MSTYADKLDVCKHVMYVYEYKLVMSKYSHVCSIEKRLINRNRSINKKKNNNYSRVNALIIILIILIYVKSETGNYIVNIKERCRI